jgi:O-antigen/teichoic acid export membrane protein
MASVRKAFFLVTTERYIGVVIGTLMVPLMSRLLTPAEVGVWVVACAIVILLASAREFATYNFLIQQSVLSHDDIRASITIGGGITLALSTVLAIGAPWLAALYQSEGLTRFLWVVSVAVLMDIVLLPISYLLRREMAFGKLVAINVSNTLVNAGTSLSLAILGFSYMSYAWGWFAGTAVATALALYLYRDPSIFQPTLRNWREPLAFGRYYGTNALLYKAYESVVYVIGGRTLSLNAIALYSRALAVVQIPDKAFFSGVATLTLPAFSAQVREGHNPKAAYLRAIEYMTCVQWPALILMALLAYPVVEIVLGRQWLETVPVVQILAIAGLFSFTAHLDYAVLIAVGAMRDNTRRALIVVPISTAVLVCASWFGLKAVAASQLALVPFETCVSFFFLRQHVSIPWGDLIAALRKSLAVTAFSAIGATLAVTMNFGIERSFWIILVTATFAGTGWLAGIWLFRHPLLDELGRAADAVRHSAPAKKAIEAISRMRR